MDTPVWYAQNLQRFGEKGTPSRGPAKHRKGHVFTEKARNGAIE